MADLVTRSPSPALQNEFAWALRRIGVIFRCWTMPLNSTSVQTIPPEERTSARAFALVLIVALTFAIRGDASSGTQATYTALASSIAVVLSLVLNAVSEQVNVQIREQVVISAYASTILVMILFIFIEQLFSGMNAYEAYRDRMGAQFGPVMIAAVATYGLFVLKSLAYDRNRIAPIAWLYGAAIVLGSATIVYLIAVLSNPVFRWIIERLKSLGA